MNPTQPPPELRFPLKSTFVCFFRPIKRLMKLLNTLKQVQESLKQVNLSITIEVNTNGIQFKILKGDQLLTLFTLLPKSDIAIFEFNDTVTYQIEYSRFISLIEKQVRNVDHILLYKIPGNPLLHCRYLDEEKKTRFDNAPLSQLEVPIEFNRQGLKPVFTAVISCNQWSTGALRLLGKRKKTDIVEEVIFEINPNMVKIYTGKYGDDTKSCTYEQNQGDCQIKIEDEANEHGYRVYVPFVVEKPLMRASELTHVGVLRLYYGNKAWMTLSFESGGDNGGNIMFVYYPRFFMDVY